ncbi:MAG TPA: AraC family transcriptional regulator ligand-binding domain-containing protein [Hyphomicrobium sp.]|nr:AraC family transcriptional regulator ligand-binding domain-containing protein [Hyphomicrobium sp.]
MQRVLKVVDLPLGLLERPETLVPLREQFRLLERSARETGDDYFGARLGQVVRSRDLSHFGAWVCSAATLSGAISRAHAGINTMLQTSTVLTFAQHGETVHWHIEFVEPESEGRHHNELLGVSYMIDTVRAYAGRAWRPDVVFTAFPRGSPRAALEDIFRCNVSHGHPVPGIAFSAALLQCPNATAMQPRAGACAEPGLPGQQDTLASVAVITDLALHEGLPRIDWVAAKLGMTRRSLQRLLAKHGTSFNRLAEEALMRRAIQRLGDDDAAITAIALELGYADTAHFTRAFRRWTGMPPSVYRHRLA